MNERYLRPQPRSVGASYASMAGANPRVSLLIVCIAGLWFSQSVLLLQSNLFLRHNIFRDVCSVIRKLEFEGSGGARLWESSEEELLAKGRIRPLQEQRTRGNNTYMIKQLTVNG
jgi:hypothetical protein